MYKYLFYIRFVANRQAFLDGEYEEDEFDEEMILQFEANNAEEASVKLEEWAADPENDCGIVHWYLQYNGKVE